MLAFFNRRLLAAVLALSSAWLLPARASAQVGFGAPCCDEGCGPSVAKHHCPHPIKHIYEAPPKIHFCHGCNKPICNPCNLPNWGYTQTCWTPWPWPPDWSHCPSVPPAATVMLNPQPRQFHLGAPPAEPRPSTNGIPNGTPGDDASPPTNGVIPPGRQSMLPPMAPLTPLLPIQPIRPADDVLPPPGEFDR